MIPSRALAPIRRSAWWAGPLLLLAALLSAGPVAGAGSDGDTPVARVVYHLDSADRAHFSNVLRYLKEHLAESERDAADVRIVLHGEGVRLLEAESMDTATAIRIDTLRLQGFRFLVSRRSMEVRGLERGDLHDVIREEVVGSGITELYRLQRQGFTYIKP
ncbi:DsrE family protein [Thioalkalivibrio halophilus]|uniref:DsrE family protein n=1 Tax=Thioalkalivibrio halophilus TaxID=252474 RepID=UPI001FCAA205|nr:DsrE family protein [Thioalkalivibrio halophilus]